MIRGMKQNDLETLLSQLTSEHKELEGYKYHIYLALLDAGSFLNPGDVRVLLDTLKSHNNLTPEYDVSIDSETIEVLKTVINNHALFEHICFLTKQYNELMKTIYGGFQGANTLDYKLVKGIGNFISSNCKKEEPVSRFYKKDS
jgi:hypothetical protein